MKQKIIEYFNGKNKYVSIKEIIKHLNITEKDYPILINTLYELECSGFIMGDKDSMYLRVPKDYIYKQGTISISKENNRYIDMGRGNIAIVPSKEAKKYKDQSHVFFECIPVKNYPHQFIAKIIRVAEKPIVQNRYLIKAIVERDYSKNYFFVRVNNQKIYIPNNYINGADVGDEVDVLISYSEQASIAHVQKVLEKHKKEHIFSVYDDSGKLKARSISTSNFIVDELPEEVNIGDFLIYEIDKDGNYEFIKKMNSVDNEMELYAEEFGIDVKFKPEVIKEVESLNKTISEEEIKKRVDLRNLITITIDGEKSKDLDDAVSLEKSENGNFILYVSIADVSHYVKPGSELFNEAYKRGTSTYPANQVIPMFPFQLSNGICSLNESEDKLTKTIKIEITPTGKIVDYSIFKSVIRSNKKMSYEKVNSLLNGIDYNEEYLPFYEILKDMNDLSNILEHRRAKRGCMSLNIAEYEYEINEFGEVEDVYVRERDKAQLMIENFMILANEIVAKYFEYLDTFGVYRCHKAPDLDKIYKLKKTLNNLGKFYHISSIKNPNFFKNLMRDANKKDLIKENPYFSKILLGSMEKAYFSTINIGHFGLALDEYAMFTSPIRRFADLMNHLIIGYALDGEFDKIDELSHKCEDMCIHTSEKEYQSDSFEKNIDLMLMNKYLEKYKGSPLIATIICIDKSKDCVYVKTNLGIYGIIPVNRKSIKSPTEAIVNGSKVAIGDSIVVEYSSIQDYFTETTFNYLGKDTNGIRKLVKDRREKND